MDNKLNNDQCRKLISLYGANNWLWDPRDPNYTNRGLREDAWLNISRKMNMPVSELKKKMESLMGSYRREKSREKKSIIMGSGRDDIYKSSWFAYDSFAFMSDRNDPGSTRETLQNDPETEEEESRNSGKRGASPASATVAKRVKLAKRRSGKKPAPPPSPPPPAHRHDPCASCAISNYLRRRDEAETVGRGWAIELEKMDETQQLFAKKAISDILMEGRLGNLHRNAVQIVPPSPPPQPAAAAWFPAESPEDSESEHSLPEMKQERDDC